MSAAKGLTILLFNRQAVENQKAVDEGDSGLQEQARQGDAMIGLEHRTDRRLLWVVASAPFLNWTS